MLIHQFFDIRAPIIQAPMAGVQDHQLAVAAGRGGGLGSLPGAMFPPEELEAEINRLRESLSAPYNLNFFAHAPPQVDDAAIEDWYRTLAPYFKAYGIHPEDIPRGPSRQPFSHSVADVIEPFKPPIVSFHFGLPAADLLQRVKSWGTVVLSTATTLLEAEWLAANGADMIIVQGLEAGGHRGMFLDRDPTTQIGTFALLPLIASKVDLPVIAAGGIASPAAVKAAISLGAAGVQVGTSYLLCDEAKTKPLHREALKSDAIYHTALTNLFSGGYARGMLNRVMRELGPISTAPPAFPLAGPAMSAIRAKAEASGSSDFSPLWCGQNGTGCREISAQKMTEYLISEL